MRRVLPLLILVAATGCRNDYEEFTPILTLVVSVSDPTPTAGDEIEYLAYIDGPSAPIAVSPAFVSDIEPSLIYWEGMMQPRVAGEQTLTATAEYNGKIYEAVVELDVSAGPPARVDLALADYSAPAGVEIPYAIAAWDKWGNALGTNGVDLSLDSFDVTDSGDAFRSIVPGLYSATATLDGVEDTEQFVITAGLPASLQLTLSDTELEVDETTIATVTVLDAYGNEVEDDWSLSVDPPTGVAQSYNALTFRSEGQFTVWAYSEDRSLSDSVGPLLIDSTGPDLEVLFPPRGEITTDFGQTVYGSASDEYTGVASITVNGDPAAINGESWSVWQDYEFGINGLETLAVDGDDNVTTDIRAAMSGDYTPYAQGIEDGMQVRVSEGGFDTLEDMASGFIDTDLLESSIPNPVVSQSSQSCAFSICVTWYSLNFYLENPSISSTQLEIDPTSGGYLDTYAIINDPHLDYRASGRVVGISYSASGSIDADWIRLDMNMWPSVNSSQQIELAVTDASASTQNFDFYLDSWIWDVVDFFGIPIDSLIEGYLVDALADMAQDEVPALVEDAVQDLEIGFTFDVGENTYDFDALPWDILIDDHGMTLSLESYFTAASWESSFNTAPGSLTYPYTPPSYANSSSDMAIGLSQDFLNQVFFAFWAGGLLDMEMAGDDLGLGSDELALFLPDLESLTIATRAYLPPAVVPGTGNELLDLQVGDLELSLYNGAVDEANLYLRVYVSLEAGLGLSATANNTLLPSLGDLDLTFDLVHPNDRSQYAGNTEALLNALVPMLLPTLTDALGEVPIPDFDGYGLGNVAIGLDGAEDGYVTLGGSLTVNN
ncbi:MAG: hypothetical protein H6741_03295 [Alphaproteobacteria bacterium]|nr:hypothetical protein [Alphaproteobacteria bacterium]